MDENDEGSHDTYFLLAEMAFGTGISASTAQAIDYKHNSTGRDGVSKQVLCDAHFDGFSLRKVLVSIAQRVVPTPMSRTCDPCTPYLVNNVILGSVGQPSKLLNVRTKRPAASKCVL